MVIAKGKANIKDIFKTLIVIKISLIRFMEGGAAILAEISINHIKFIKGWVGPNPLFIKRLRELLFS